MTSKKYDLVSFPIEIQEMILSKLSEQNLVSMSKVCRLWHTICGWIAKKKYSKVIPEECIAEIRSNGILENNVWLTALHYHYLSKSVANNILALEQNILMQFKQEHVCLCVHGPFIFFGCSSGGIEVYKVEENHHPVLVLMVKLEENPIFQLEIIATKNLLLAKAGRNDLTFFSLPYFTERSWMYKMNHLKPNIQNFTGELHCIRNISINGSFIAAVTNIQQVSIFQVLSVTKKTVELKCLMNFIVDEPVGLLSLWENEVIILCKGGEILQWCLSTQNKYVSHRYHEIQYENPVWIFQGRIFCSTFISSKMLGYWHVDTGPEYWLLGKPACDLVPCRNLGTLFSAGTSVEEVLCVSLKQRLLACGTQDGKILVYYLSDKFFSTEDFNMNGNEHMAREFSRVPDLTIRTKSRPLKNIQIHFEENCIKIYAWPYLEKNRPERKEILQCIILRLGEWVKQN